MRITLRFTGVGCNPTHPTASTKKHSLQKTNMLQNKRNVNNGSVFSYKFLSANGNGISATSDKRNTDFYPGIFMSSSFETGKHFNAKHQENLV